MLIQRLFGWFFVGVPLKLLDSERILMVWIWRFFSVGYFLPRIFSPWHKDITGYGRGFDLKVWVHAIGWNLISRFIGAILRLFFIITGVTLEALAIVESLAAVAFWYGSPALIGYLLISGAAGL